MLRLGRNNLMPHTDPAPPPSLHATAKARLKAGNEYVKALWLCGLTQHGVGRGSTPDDKCDSKFKKIMYSGLGHDWKDPVGGVFRGSEANYFSHL